MVMASTPLRLELIGDNQLVIIGRHVGAGSTKGYGMFSIKFSSDPLGEQAFKMSWRAQDDIVIEKLLFQIDKIKRSGPESVTALECLDETIETHAIPVHHTRLKLICAVQNQTITLLSIVSGVGFREQAFSEACSAYRLSYDIPRRPGAC